MCLGDEVGMTDEIFLTRYMLVYSKCQESGVKKIHRKSFIMDQVAV